MKLPKHVQEAITARRRAKQFRERQQLELLHKEDLWHTTIANKLDQLGIPIHVPVISGHDKWGEPIQTGWRLQNRWLLNFLRCGTESINRVCVQCGDVHTFKVNCSQKWCPRCQWRLTKTRVRLITEWAKQIETPVHLVLTQRNFPTLTRTKLREHVRNLARIRRQKCMTGVAGGTVSIEITNEGRGWHLHSHWLLKMKTARLAQQKAALFHFQSQIALAWGKLVGQEFAIVKAKPITDTDYLGECCKYVAKPNEVAEWPAEEIWEYANAIRGRRFFFTFGELTKLAPQIRADLNKQNAEPQACECGSMRFKFTAPTLATLTA